MTAHKTPEKTSFYLPETHLIARYRSSMQSYISSTRKLKPFPTIANDYLGSTSSKKQLKSEYHSVLGLPPPLHCSKSKKSTIGGSPNKYRGDSLHKEIVNDLANAHIEFMKERMMKPKVSKRRLFKRSKSPPRDGETSGER